MDKFSNDVYREILADSPDIAIANTTMRKHTEPMKQELMNLVALKKMLDECIVKEGEKVKQGQIIGKVGPKYVYGVVGNKYADSTRKTNKWSNNRTTLTFWNTYKWRIYQSIRFLLNYTN